MNSDELKKREELLFEIRQGEKSIPTMQQEATVAARMQEMQKEIFGDSGSGNTTAESSRSSSPEPEELYNGMSKDELELFAKKIGVCRLKTWKKK